jgi:hypothetical protein
MAKEDFKTLVASDGTLTIEAPGKTYRFRAPLAADLSDLQRNIVSTQATDIESLAFILAKISLDTLTDQHFLGLDAYLFVKLGEIVRKHFRVFSLLQV